MDILVAPIIPAFHFRNNLNMKKDRKQFEFLKVLPLKIMRQNTKTRLKTVQVNQIRL
jgi:hypothetical protein